MLCKCEICFQFSAFAIAVVIASLVNNNCWWSVWDNSLRPYTVSDFAADFADLHIVLFGLHILVILTPPLKHTQFWPTMYLVPALRTSAAFAPHSLKSVEEWGFILRTAWTYVCHLRGQNLANAVSAMLHLEHPLHLRSQTISWQQFQSWFKTHLFKRTYIWFYLRELLRSELTYWLTL